MGKVEVSLYEKSSEHHATALLYDQQHRWQTGVKGFVRKLNDSC